MPEDAMFGDVLKLSKEHVLLLFMISITHVFIAAMCTMRCLPCAHFPQPFQLHHPVSPHCSHFSTQFPTLSSCSPPDRYSHPSTQFDMRALLDLELVLLEELGFNLVLFSPYDSLAQLANDAGHPTLLAAAWGVVNDAHCTPLVLCHPPHILSVASLVTVRTRLASWWRGAQKHQPLHLHQLLVGGLHSNACALGSLATAQSSNACQPACTCMLHRHTCTHSHTPATKRDWARRKLSSGSLLHRLQRCVMWTCSNG